MFKDRRDLPPRQPVCSHHFVGRPDKAGSFLARPTS
jgi:hypothetical protein